MFTSKLITHMLFILICIFACNTLSADSYIDTIKYHLDDKEQFFPPVELQRAINYAYLDRNKSAIDPIFSILISKKYCSLPISKPVLTNFLYEAIEIDSNDALPYILTMAKDRYNCISLEAIGCLMNKEYKKALPEIKELGTDDYDYDRQRMLNIVILYLEFDNSSSDINKVKSYWQNSPELQPRLLQFIDSDNVAHFRDELSSCLTNNSFGIGFKQECVIKIIDCNDDVMINGLEIKLLQDDPDVSFLILNHAPKYDILSKHCKEFKENSNAATRAAAIKCVEQMKGNKDSGR